MFTRARLRLTLLYAGMLAATLVLVVGVVAVRAVHEAREVQDEGLHLQAEELADRVLQSGAAAAAASDDTLRLAAPPIADREHEGIFSAVLPVQNGHVEPPAAGAGHGFPDPRLAQNAVARPGSSTATVTLSGNDGVVRVVSLPVQQYGQTTAVVQVARSQQFVERSVTRLVVTALAAGLAGLVVSVTAGFWVAGRTLRPIAAALERQRAFTADASHELRTPLSVVLGNAEYLARHSADPIADHLDAVGDIVDDSRRLTRLVADLLTLARADEGAPQFADGDVDLSALATDVARHFEAARALEDRALPSGLKVESERGIRVRGDSDRLREVMVILLDNAARHAPGAEIRLRVAAEAGWAVLAVSDTGAGIPREHLPRLFERFYRVDAARSPDGGVGLGLAIAQSIAERQRGRIDVASTPGQGTTFTLRLPAIGR